MSYRNFNESNLHVSDFLIVHCEKVIMSATNIKVTLMFYI